MDFDPVFQMKNGVFYGKENMEKQKKSIWKIVYVILIVLCLLCIGGMLLYLNNDQQEEAAVEEQQEELQQQYVDRDAESETVQVEKAELPIDFAGLQEINPEIYAWIRIPDTNIDYPILQHLDDDQTYYLSRDIYGESNQAGSLYTEYYNSRDFQEPNTIIYGHNMKNGSMFHNIRYFAEQEYFDEHEELYIYLPDKIMKYQIIACYEYDDRHLLGSFDFHDEEVYAEYLEEIMNPRSMYAMIREGVELTTEDKLVTLSTCVANKPNNRRLLQAVLVEEVEAEYRGAANEDANKAEN